MKRLIVVIAVLVVSVVVSSAQEPYGFSINCINDQASFDNGVRVRVVQLRSGYDYTATAIGMNGFDPVLAVLDEDGNGLCSDDNADASYYQAWLPTTGEVPPSSTTAQVNFANNSSNTFEDVDLIVGGFSEGAGEFILILEGMYAGSADGVGDVFSVTISGNMVQSEVPLNAYMMAVTNVFDPLMYVTDINTDDWSQAVVDNDGNAMYCDDSGNPEVCWGAITDMTKYYVSRTGGRYVEGLGTDAMLSLPLVGFEYDPELTYTYTFVATSFQRQTEGDYLVAFHFANGASTSGGE
jgi:hypothetical protein